MAVTEAVTNAVNIDMIFIPVMIQMKQKSLPGNDFGELSPYLVKKKKKKTLSSLKKGYVRETFSKGVSLFFLSHIQQLHAI